MNRPRVTLYEFVPYGAPELLEVREPYLTRALTTASSGLVVLFVLALATSAWLARHGPGPRTIPDVVFTLEPPPSIHPPALPREPSAPAITPPTTARPMPVPDRLAPTEITVPSQDELRRSIPGVTSGEDHGGGIAPAPPVDEAPPALDDYRYFDEAPAAVTRVRPAYPDLARDAGVEGTVYMRVLVGKDGRVKDVHVDRSVPLLDEAAVAAARQWVFTPALAGGHPIMVWVAIPVRFTLH